MVGQRKTVSTSAENRFLKFGDTKVFPGERKKVFLDVASLYDYTQLNIPIEVIRGKQPGPIMFICSAIHGDEINGVETIRKLLKKKALKGIKGTLIAVPVVNVFGYNNKSRYLPDRRDLNRNFPGSPNGSLASRLAHFFIKEVVSKCTHGIDLHTGAIHRGNLPQLRASLDDAETKELAKCFGVPVVIDAALRDGSLREAARKRKVKTLLFEGGEALRFEPHVIQQALRGCLAVMRKVGMLPPSLQPLKVRQSFLAKSSYWLRASHSGAFSAFKKLGDHVEAGDVLAVISDTFGENPYPVVASEAGIVIGVSYIPLVNRGEAMFHVATFKNTAKVKNAIDLLDEL